MKIFPIPQNIIYQKNQLENKRIGLVENDFGEKILDVAKAIVTIDKKSKTLLSIKKDSNISNDEGYILIIQKNSIEIKANKENGAFYGLMTLKQIYQDDVIKEMKIEDYPDLKVRGVMLDISRSKVPSIKTIKELIDLFASLKYNHLELYVEGFSFEYKSFPNVLSDRNYLTFDEYLEIEAYAIDHYIDFVPNQNGFGHMADWLQKDEYKELAENEDGFFIWGCHRIPTTLDPTNPKSAELVKKMYDDMLPYTKSKYFNMNFDEPYELGSCKSKSKCEKSSKEEVYIQYFNELAEYVRKYKKIPMLWGDVLIKHPDKVKLLPKDVIFIDWGYNKDYPFNEHAKILEENNVNYLLAPGTSSWSTITSRLIDMKETIENSTISAKKHCGLGVVLTDWGDMGHLQYLPSSYLGFIYAGMLMWSTGTLDDAKMLLNDIVNDDTLAEVIIDLSTYHLLEGEYRDYGSRLFTSIMWAEHAKRQNNPKEFFLEKMKYNYLARENKAVLKQVFKENEEKLKLVKPSLEKDELSNALYLLKILLSINDKLSDYEQQCVVSFDEEIEKLKNYLNKHLMLWCTRNKKEGYEFSANRINWLIEMLMCLDRKERV